MIMQFNKYLKQASGPVLLIHHQLKANHTDDNASYNSYARSLGNPVYHPHACPKSYTPLA